MAVTDPTQAHTGLRGDYVGRLASNGALLTSGQSKRASGMAHTIS